MGIDKGLNYSFLQQIVNQQGSAVAPGVKTSPDSNPIATSEQKTTSDPIEAASHPQLIVADVLRNFAQEVPNVSSLSDLLEKKKVPMLLDLICFAVNKKREEVTTELIKTVLSALTHDPLKGMTDTGIKELAAADYLGNITLKRNLQSQSVAFVLKILDEAFKKIKDSKGNKGVISSELLNIEKLYSRIREIQAQKKT